MAAPCAVFLLALAASGCAARNGARDRGAAGTDASKAGAGVEEPIAPSLSAEPIILPGRGSLGADGKPVGGGAPSDKKARRKVDETDETFREKFAAANEAHAAGEDEAALAIIGAALDMNPKAPWDQRFHALKSDVRAHHLDTNVLRIDVRPQKDYVGFGEDVDLLVRIHNVGKADVVIRPPTSVGFEAVSGSTLVLTMKRTDRDIYAAELSHSWTQNVPLLASGGQELRIPMDGVHEIRVRVPADEVGDAIAGMKVLDLSGELRAGRILVGIEEPFGRVPIRPGRVVVLPANYEPLAADPLGSISKSVDALAPVHLLVATEFLSADDRPAAVGIIARALATSPIEMRPAALNALDLVRRAAAGSPVRPLAAPLMDALAAHPERAADLMEALHILTLVTHPPDARLWEDWWRRERKGPGALLEFDDTSPARKIDLRATDATPKFDGPLSPR